jgi:hypothetical protein
MIAELNGIFTPVILGSSYRALRLALKLRLTYGVTSHVFDTHHSLIARALPFTVCHSISYSSEEILLIDLEHTARLHEHTILYLTPTKEPYVSFVQRMRSQLEDKFVIVTDPCDLDPKRRE